MSRIRIQYFLKAVVWREKKYMLNNLTTVSTLQDQRNVHFCKACAFIEWHCGIFDYIIIYEIQLNGENM